MSVNDTEADSPAGGVQGVTRAEAASGAGVARDQPVPRTRRSEVRDRLLAAAEAEFVQRGYRGSSLAGIARRAGFTKGAVYSNFDSKQSLLAAMLSDRSARATRSALDRLSSDSRAGGTPDIGRAGGAVGGAGSGGTPSPSGLAARAADLLAGEVLESRRAALLLTELALHASQDADAARSYTAFRRAQQDALAQALSDHVADLGLRRDADLAGAAFLLVTLMSSLAVECAADPRSVDRGRIVAALTTVLSALIDEAARPQAP